MSRLIEALQEFALQCNTNSRLRQMNKGWTRDIAIKATNTDGAVIEQCRLVSDDGLVRVEQGELHGVDMEITASVDILVSVFSGQMSPTEPYNAGDLLVHGHQDDIMRLDILTLLIWGQ